jgi:hypothetical protein
MTAGFADEPALDMGYLSLPADVQHQAEGVASNCPFCARIAAGEYDVRLRPAPAEAGGCLMVLCDRLIGYYGWRDPREMRCCLHARHPGGCLATVRPGPLPWLRWRPLTVWADGSHLRDPAWLEAEALALRKLEAA